MRILVAVRPVDFRKGIDGLVQLCKESLREDPFRGTVFAFRNRRGTSLKLLAYDGQGFWLCQKRLSESKFRWWPHAHDGQAAKLLVARELQVLLAAGDPSQLHTAPDWRRISPSA